MERKENSSLWFGGEKEATTTEPGINFHSPPVSYCCGGGERKREDRARGETKALEGK